METTSKKALHCPNCGANVALDAIHCDFCRATLTITACPSCFGAVFKGMKHCPDCGSAIERAEIRNEQKRTCPRCEKDLVPADIGGTRIQECSTCGGIWLDAAAFQKTCADREQQEKVVLYPDLAKSNILKSEQPPKRFYIPCPECGELMTQKNFAGCSGVVIDVCKPHGIWLDRQELQRIVNFIKDGGLHKSRERELANLKAEQDRLRAMQYDQGMKSFENNEPLSFLDHADDRSLRDILFSLRQWRL